jgi:hypothetical protein
MKRYIRHSLGVKIPRGFGIFTSPKKALYNKIYRKTTVEIEDIGKLGGKRKSKSNSSFTSNNNMPKPNLSNSNDPGKIIRSISKALTVTSQNFIDLRKEINEIYQLRTDLSKKLQSTKLKFYALTLVHALSYPLIFGFFYKKVAETRTSVKAEIKNLEDQIGNAFVKLTFAD